MVEDRQETPPPRCAFALGGGEDGPLPAPVDPRAVTAQMSGWSSSGPCQTLPGCRSHSRPKRRYGAGSTRSWAVSGGRAPRTFHVANAGFAKSRGWDFRIETTGSPGDVRVERMVVKRNGAERRADFHRLGDGLDARARRAGDPWLRFAMRTAFPPASRRHRIAARPAPS
jgi:hypothetical protein